MLKLLLSSFLLLGILPSRVYSMSTPPGVCAGNVCSPDDNSAVPVPVLVAATMFNPQPSIFDFSADTLTGETVNLSSFKTGKKAFLIVNVASQ
jgi:hypothetical protein